MEEIVKRRKTKAMNTKQLKAQEKINLSNKKEDESDI